MELRQLGGLALLQVGANAFPILAVPLFGAALAAGNAGLAVVAARFPLDLPTIR